MARIICVCNQKGGCGKTTITMALAAAFASNQYKVLVVDGDPQGSASTWSANAPDNAPFPAAVANLARSGKSLPSEVKKMVDDYDVVLIDCPPSVDSPVAQASLLITDLALVPLIPSPADMAAVSPFIQLVENARIINSSLQALIVPNMVQRNTKVALGYLEQFQELGIPTARTQLSQRTAHRQACALGTSVHALADKEAIQEIDALVKEVRSLVGLDKKSRAVA